ncbi:uncharacterized protein LOC129571193 isoform X2 [Sitodiplosis mosellana]|uniref:uncharacterized protein LOC129571193 isoform X2 n=1 Tax=Sitodiplosis mosellana TaxID=263140 RepID=UPI0024448176|nr:uncharacterized protein LOC129571193 isoform X2 [Sitodiplosis mosellana]
MEIFHSLTEYLVQLCGHSSYHRLISLFSNSEFAQNARLGLQRAIDILTAPDFMKNASIFVALSYVGVLIGGPIGLALGGIAAFGMVKWQKAFQLPNTISSNAQSLVHNLKLPHFITVATVSAVLSFLCFILGGRVDVAIGGMLGQLIAYTAVELKYLEPVIQNAKYVVFCIATFVSGLIGYYWPDWQIVYGTFEAAYKTLYPCIPFVVELVKHPHFLGVVISMFILCIAILGSYLNCYEHNPLRWRMLTTMIGEISRTTTKSLASHVIKRAVIIVIGICGLVGLVTFGIYNWEIVHQKVKLTYECLSPIIIHLSEYLNKTIEVAHKELHNIMIQLPNYVAKPHFVKRTALCIIVSVIGLIAYKIYQRKRDSSVKTDLAPKTETQIPFKMLYYYLKSTRTLKGAAIGAGTSFTLGLSAIAIWKWPTAEPVLMAIIRNLLNAKKTLLQLIKTKYFIIGAVVYMTFGLISMLIYVVPQWSIILSRVKATITEVRCAYLELEDLVIEICLNFYFSICFTVYDAQEFLSLFNQNLISQLNANEIFTSLLRKVNESIYKTIDLIKGCLSLMESQLVNMYIIKLIEAINKPEFVNGALVCAGFSVIGFLFGGLNGFVIGLILAELFLQGISQYPNGSTALGDAIIDNLGIPQTQTHWLNLFGTVYKLELPKEDISTLQQWEEHKKTAVFQSFFSFIRDELRLKVSELHVKLNRSEDSTQNRLIESKVSSQTRISRRNDPTCGRETNVNATQNDEHKEDGDSVDISTEQCTMNIGASGEKPYAISMIFGQ